MHVRLGDLLVQFGVLTADQRDLVLEEQRLVGLPFGVLAENMFGVSRSDIERAWGEQHAMLARQIDPLAVQVDAHVLNFIERRQAWQFRALPLRFDGDDLIVCSTRDHLVRALKFTGWRIGHPCVFVLADAHALGEALVKYYPIDGMTAESIRGPLTLRRA